MKCVSPGAVSFVRLRWATPILAILPLCSWDTKDHHVRTATFWHHPGWNRSFQHACLHQVPSNTITMQGASSYQLPTFHSADPTGARLSGKCLQTLFHFLPLFLMDLVRVWQHVQWTGHRIVLLFFFTGCVNDGWEDRLEESCICCSKNQKSQRLKQDSCLFFLRLLGCKQPRAQWWQGLGVLCFCFTIITVLSSFIHRVQDSSFSNQHGGGRRSWDLTPTLSWSTLKIASIIFSHISIEQTTSIWHHSCEREAKKSSLLFTVVRLTMWRYGCVMVRKKKEKEYWRHLDISRIHKRNEGRMSPNPRRERKRYIQTPNSREKARNGGWGRRGHCSGPGESDQKGSQWHILIMASKDAWATLKWQHQLSTMYPFYWRMVMVVKFLEHASSISSNINNFRTEELCFGRRLQEKWKSMLHFAMASYIPFLLSENSIPTK